jgi:hypothetical protein
MTARWWQRAAIGAASRLAPAEERAEWLREWRAELWYVPPEQAPRFCLGAFADAFWLRREAVACAGGLHLPMESAGGCLGVLAVSAMVSAAVSLVLPLHSKWWPQPGMRLADLPAGWLLMLIYTAIFLGAMRLAMGSAEAPDAPSRGRLRRGLFFATKIALVQPAVFAGFLVVIAWKPIPVVGPFVMPMGLAWLVRWTIVDQRERCPECLRRLARPVRIGTVSKTFLDWHGAESVCDRGHGLMQVAEMPSSYGGAAKWLRLDGSWRGLFSHAGARH